MIHGMAEQLGGRLALSSEKGKGTTAELWLPAADAALRAIKPAQAATQTTDAGDALTILVVDDDRLVLFNTCAMLEELGHTVSQASSGKEALAYLRGGGAADLIVTDHAMPQMTGAELAEIVKTERPGLPILMVSGYAELPAGAASALPRLTKPFSIDDLGGAVARPGIKSAP